MASSPTPLGAIARGLLAGAAGTAAMTAAQSVYYKATGAEGSMTPAEVAKKLAGVVGIDIPEDRMETVNTGMHIAYGTGWGVAYGIVAGSFKERSVLKAGLAFGLSVWGASLVELPAFDLAPPVWKYPPSAFPPDIGFHLVYGAAVAAAYELIA